MSKEEKIKKIVEEKFSCSAHNLEHVERVYNNCLSLAEEKEVDLKVLKIAALLHDIGRAEEDNDKSGKTDHAVLGAEKAGKILKDFDFSQEKIKKIKKCILAHRYKNEYEPQSEEAKILFDADKLDSLGAIGVARAYVWVEKNNSNMYKEVNDLQEYAKENLEGGLGGKIKDPTKHSPQIEFETKIKLIKNKMYTKKGRKRAEERLDFYENFLKRLKKEIKGEL